MRWLLSYRPVIRVWIPAPSSTANGTLLSARLEAAAQSGHASSPTLKTDAKLNRAQNKWVRRMAGSGKGMRADLSSFPAYLCGFLKFATFRQFKSTITIYS